MNQLVKVVAAVINVPVEQLTPQSGPENLPAWDSVAHIGIVAAVEETYGVQFTTAEMLAIRTLADLQDLLERRDISVGS